MRGCWAVSTTATASYCGAGCCVARTPCQWMRRPWRRNDRVSARKFDCMVPNVSKKSTPRMKSKQPRRIPTHVMEKDSSLMMTGTSRAMPAQGRRSPLATVTRRCSPPAIASPRRLIMSPLRKLWVDPVSMSASSRSPLMVTGSSSVLSVRMPASALTPVTSGAAGSSRGSTPPSPAASPRKSSTSK
jgi:hypothetical protein